MKRKAPRAFFSKQKDRPMADPKFTKGRNYSFSLKVGVENPEDGTDDLSIYLDSIRFVNTMGSIYPTFIFLFKADATEIISRNMYGENTLKFTVSLDKEDGNSVEFLNLELLYLQSNLSLVPKTMGGTTSEDKDLGGISLSAIILPCYNMMSTLINYIFEERASVGPFDALLEALLDKVNGEIEFDKKGKNEEEINQCIIPTMSVIKTIDFFNETYGLFEGPLHRYCIWDNKKKESVLQMWDLSKRIKTKPVAKIWHLPAGAPAGEVESIIEKCDQKPHYYYTDSPLMTLHHANSNVINATHKKKQIIHPDDLLFFNIENNLDDVMENLGVYDDNDSMKFNEDMVGVTPDVCTGLKGLARNTYALSSRMAKQIQNTTSVKLTIIRNVDIENLIKIGSPIQLEPMSESYLGYQGKFILQTSDIQWFKGGSEQWNCNATLTMFRSNQEK